MSKLLETKEHHKLEWKGIHEESGLWRYNMLLRPAAVQRQMGRDPIVLVSGKRYFKLKKVRPLKRAAPAGPRKWFRVGLEPIES